MNEPLKDKGRYFEGQISRIPTYSCNPNQIFRGEDIKSAVEWLKEYLGNPIYYFGRFPKQLKSFWKCVGVNPDTMVEGELINYIFNFNEWLVYKAFPDLTEEDKG